MKILVIWRRLSIGGVNAGWRNRAAYFYKHGITTDFLYTEDNGGRVMMESVSQLFITSNNEDILRLLKENNYDCLINIDYQEMYPLIAQSGFAGKIIFESRVPIKSYVRRQYKNLGKLRPSYIVVPSNFQKSLVNSVLSTKTIPVQVIHNTVNTTLFKPMKKEHCFEVPEPLLPQNKKIIAWIGNINNLQKNWEFLLKVVSRITTYRNDLYFWIIGGIKSKEKERFLLECKRLGIEKYLTWFPSISYKDLPLYYNKVAYSGGCLFSTTKFESFGNIFTEAMACGCPVIAPQNSAIPEVITDDCSGKLYKTNNTKMAIRQIHSLLDDTKTRNRLIKNALLEVEEKFSTEVSGKQYVEFIKQIING
ncbi:glycosyltransferase family 4 protein [Bacillus sp. FJAT-45350]|uniref:glycosyltransferase family 4 protein n=1 Tax=Bacillus sp. FJAT-45350 TaxID=2011014 RepID=UPI000BB7FDA3|nr:glycosyltransferase family 4 protein [Bacillus sp. FJAT-45350]